MAIKMSNEQGNQKRPNPRVLSGFRDFLPAQMRVRQQVTGMLRGIFERFGYEPLDTPTLEAIEVLQGKIGQDEKLLYRFTDHGGREVGMRYDLTIPLARVVAMHANDLVLPFKRYHMGPVWRADRPQKGRFREFWQCDADVVGTRSVIADAEGVAIYNAALSGCGFTDYAIRVNHRAILAALAPYAGLPERDAVTIIRAIDKLDKIGPEGVRTEMVDRGIPEAAAERVLELVSITGPNDVVLAKLTGLLNDVPAAQAGLNDLAHLFDYAAALGVPEGKAVLFPALARGLDYYTGPVFETYVPEGGGPLGRIGSLGGGGRYDNLIGALGGRDLPATGISVGLERLLVVMEERGMAGAAESVTKALVTVLPNDDPLPALRLAAELRDANIPTEVTFEPKRSLLDQFKYAERKGIPYALIAGSDERAAGTVTVRTLATRAQQQVPHADLAATLHRLLNG
jgi:histidyl-tRNA synthetase